MVNDVMQELAAKHPRSAPVARLEILKPGTAAGSARGLTNEEVADLIGLSLRTVEKEWAFGWKMSPSIRAGTPAGVRWQ